MGLFNAYKVWQLTVNDPNSSLDGMSIQGQFEATEVTEALGVSYAEHYTLNRQSGIQQFLHGTLDTLTFQARFFARDAVNNNVAERLEFLRQLLRRDPVAARPPILTFQIGNAGLRMDSCVISAIGSIVHDNPGFQGAMRGATASITLKEFVPFNPIGGEPTDTRYARVKTNDYYEMLAAREYGDPRLGDIIRNIPEHASTPFPMEGDVVKLPSVEKVRTQKVQPQSIALFGSLSKKGTDTAALKQATFDRTNKVFTSRIIPKDLT